MSHQQELDNKIETANRVIKVSVIGMIAISLLMLVLIVFQLFKVQDQIKQSTDDNRKAIAEEQNKTQQYVKCIAATLLKPLAQRTPEAFEKCGIQGTESASSSTTEPTQNESSQSSLPQNSSTGISPSQNVQPNSQQNTSQSATPANPVTPSNPQNNNNQQAEPIINNILNGLVDTKQIL